jgi:hypothetical protein
VLADGKRCRMIWTIHRNHNAQNIEVRTSKKTLRFAFKASLVLFKGLIAVYSDNHTEPMKTMAEVRVSEF